MLKNALVNATNTVLCEFAGIFDKADAPYERHCHNVSEISRNLAVAFGYDEELCAVAGLLHDLVEDIDHWSIEDVASNFGYDVAAIVDNVTKRSGESKERYLARVCSMPESMVVKIADARHNSEIGRFAYPGDREVENCTKYARLANELMCKLLEDRNV